tara:strand:- start:389 stop:664 length:276 start_codon:yes stop_codon:yes gene_type:complete
MGKKKEKVVDLKPQKITDEQLKKVQEVINAINRGQLELGGLETRKHMILHQISSIQDQLSAMQNEFKEQYGTIDINVQDGTINHSDEPSDS